VKRLPQEGEIYFKRKKFKEKSWMSFLCRSRETTVNWKSGIPRSWLVHPWDEVAYVIEKFITCEGVYSIIFLYHIRLLQHLKKEKEMNMPYFFLNSLSKMAKGIHKQEKMKTDLIPSWAH
jgi:hypothetical protein